MAGKIWSIDDRSCRGWAKLPDDPNYVVTVHLIIDDVIRASALADLSCDDDEKGEDADGAWFKLDLPDDVSGFADDLSVLVGESEDLLQPPAKRRIDAPVGAEANSVLRTAVVTYRDGLARGLTAADIIELFYLDILHRSADREGIVTNLAAFESGKLTLDGIRKSLLSSAEYKKLRLTKAAAPGRIFNYPLVIRSSTHRRQFERHAVAFQRSSAPMSERLIRFFPGLLTRPNALERMEATALRGLPAREVFCRALAHLSDQPALILSDLPEAVLPPSTTPAAGGDLTIDVPLSSPLFVLGWHRFEESGAGPFRWMRQIGVVLNPYPHREVARIDFEINGWYGPMSQAVAAASERGRLALERHQLTSGSCVLSVTGGAAGDRMDYVVLIAGEVTSPFRFDGTPDPRVLSFNLARVVFVFKEEK